MSTRSNIGIVNDDGSIDFIYCHWDGYPHHQGPILLGSYGTLTRARLLLALGDLSVLGELLEAPDGHTFEHPAERACVAYGRDRGDEGVGMRRGASVAELLAQREEYVYLFRDGAWEVSDHGAPWVALAKLFPNNVEELFAVP